MGDAGLRVGRMRRGDGPVVSAIVAGGFRVDEGVYRALLLTPDRAEGWSPPALEALTLDALAPVLTPAPEFVLLGTGTTMRRPPRAFIAALEGAGMGLEFMDSRAAARAWGVLRAEGRMIAAALYPLAA